MKFKFAVTVSILIHLSLFILAVYTPAKRNGSDTVYYVDLIQTGPGGSGGGHGGGSKGPGGANRGENDASLMETQQAGSVRDLTVAKETPASLRFPDRESRKKPEEKKLISVIRKENTGSAPKSAPGAAGIDGTNGLKMGVSTGNGSGGDGTGGNGTGGGGSGGIGGYFPYAYYVDTVRNKISSSWYNSLVSPGLKGRFLTSVYFKIQRSGQITDMIVEKTSGISTLDLSARRAVENAAPFAALPADFPYPLLIVHFEFEWEKK